MSLDESFSPLVSHRLKSYPKLLTTPVLAKKDVAPKLSLKSQSKANIDAMKTPDFNLITSENSTCGKSKQVSASFLFSSCKKKLLEDSFSDQGHTILVGDSSDEELTEDNQLEVLSVPIESDLVNESLEEYELIRKWLQNSDSFDSLPDCHDSPCSVFKKPEIKLEKKETEKSEVLSNSHLKKSSYKEEIIILSSDEDDDQFEHFLQDMKKGNVKGTAPKGGPFTSTFVDDVDLSDSFDCHFVTISLEEKLKEQLLVQSKAENLILNGEIYQSGSPVSKKPDSTMKQNVSCIKRKTTGAKEVLQMENDTDLEDIFGNLSITVTPRKPVVKPKSSKKLIKHASAETLSKGSLYESFLQSLSANVEEKRRHPNAVPFVKSFRKLRSELTQQLFTLFNENVFENQLPKDFSLTWNNRLTRTAGYCRHFTRRENGITSYESRIELSVKVVDTPCRLRDTLIHEMCHAATWMIDNCRGGHGPVWRKYANLAHKVYPDLPPITRCHNYEISYKFYYNCSKCSFSTGRHSKSIDISTHVCPLCMSKLELSRETKLKESGSSTPSIPKPPRTPNAFALFVKDHYATTKSLRPDLQHAAIMKLLSTKFAESKR